MVARTSGITVSTDRLAASLHDPIRLAEDAIALDLLSGGRFVLGLSLCYREEEFRGFGVEASTDAQTFEALVPVLRAAFDHGTASIRGRDVQVTPGPVTAHGPQLMIAAHGDQGAARAARLAAMLTVRPTEPWTGPDTPVAAFSPARATASGD